MFFRINFCFEESKSTLLHSQGKCYLHDHFPRQCKNFHIPQTNWTEQNKTKTYNAFKTFLHITCFIIGMCVWVTWSRDPSFLLRSGCWRSTLNLENTPQPTNTHNFHIFEVLPFSTNEKTFTVEQPIKEGERKRPGHTAYQTRRPKFTEP